MGFSLLFVLVSWISVILCPTLAQDGGRELYFPDYYFFAWKHLENHVIISDPVKDLDECEYRCYLNANCVSLNIKDHHNGTHECELNNSTHLKHGWDLKDSQLYYYRGAENKCGKNGLKCKNNSTCQSGFTQKGYRCLCTAGFEGEHCEKDINECHRGSHNFHSNATCKNTKGGYNCSCKEGYTGDGQNCTDINECHRGSHNCHNNAICNNTEGGYNCSCKEGYTGDGQNCTDIDECAQGNPCTDTHSECKNMDGSYNCQCKDGFEKKDGICEVDPCQRYDTFNTSDRNLANASKSHSMDSPDQFQFKWYRFKGAAGTRLPTQCPPIKSYPYPVWLNVEHNKLPHIWEGVKVIYACLPGPNFGCCRDKDYNAFIDVKNCSSYMVYKLYGINLYRYYGTN